ncbi:MAG: flap endonuclease-1 [Euryarchaeota archaeon]|jgi:flap endonuclease-1|nr:flap endonuclease-1 [Euryarchaeota archaeon]MBT3971785.1 flap endonuclease-1 [Euryarchaeota archaeon]MBT4407041.1 flap endonuclease-1 [Euryarchaeota archaeon]
MGCNLRDLATPEHIELTDLAGQKIGIDAFLVAFQFLTTIRQRGDTGDGGPLRDSKGRVVAHLMGFLERTTTFLEKGITPVWIFDGKHPELKADVVAERRAKKEAAQLKWKEALEVGDYVEAQKWGQRSVGFTSQMVEESMEMLELLGVPAIRAAAEGEAQGAVMTNRGELDGIATQDWDALLYGSPIMIRNLMSAGSKRMGKVIRAEKIVLADLLAEHEISKEQLVDLAIMIGTDFHPGIRGIGPKTGLKLIKEHMTIEAICAAKDKEIPERLDEIRQIFLNHPTNDDFDLQLKPINMDNLRAWLENRDMSNARIERNFKRLDKAGNVRNTGQSSLFDF